MAIITFISDFGEHDHYTAAVKARILSGNPSQVIVDISHHIEHYNIAHGSFVLNSVFRDFPEGSIHLIGVNATGNLGEAYIAVKLEGHYFVGTDNGFISLLSEQAPDTIVMLDTLAEEGKPFRHSTFPSRDILAPAALKLALGTEMQDLGETTTVFNRLITRKARATRKFIAGHIVHVDHYGNLITNIHKTEFEFLLQDSFKIQLGRENITKIHKSYPMVDPGDIFALFNSQDLLEFGIHSGNASELLGMGFDAPVTVHFVTVEKENAPVSTAPPLFK